MNLQFVLFIIFAGIAAFCAVMTITRKNPIISALFLILNFAALAGLYLLLNAQFIAVTQVIVYAGAIMVLFLFVIMLLRPEHEQKLSKNPGIKLLSFTIAIVVFLQIVYLIFFTRPSSVNPVMDPAASLKAGTVEEIGRTLYTNYILPFEAAGYLLLTAAIGALVLAKKKFE